MRTSYQLQSKRQHTVTLSLVEAECQAVWWGRFLTALGHDMRDPTIVRFDSQGSVQLIRHGAIGYDGTNTWRRGITSSLS